MPGGCVSHTAPPANAARRRPPGVRAGEATDITIAFFALLNDYASSSAGMPGPDGSGAASVVAGNVQATFEAAVAFVSAAAAPGRSDIASVVRVVVTLLVAVITVLMGVGVAVPVERRRMLLAVSIARGDWGDSCSDRRFSALRPGERLTI